jgi:pimeloyl-ACP methyl ester carboxylesterase
MEHKEYIREIPGSRQAVLLIHGILGTPNHFDFLLPLIPNDWSIYNILLDGHGGTVTDFSHTSMKKWKAQVATLLDDLLPHYDRVILVAHSMGTLFSIQEAVRRPDKIAHLFLLQVPLRPRLTLATACRAIVLPFGFIPKSAEMMYADCGVTLDWRLWKYIGWIPRFLELFSECRATRRILPKLTVPCYAFQSRHDELVSNHAAKDLLQYPHIQTRILPHSGHFGHTGEDMKLVQAEFSNLFP